MILTNLISFISSNVIALKVSKENFATLGMLVKVWVK